MKAKVNQDTCIGCGLCAATCPDIFEMGDDGLAKASLEEIEPEQTEAAEDARDGCPVGAIDIEE